VTEPHVGAPSSSDSKVAATPTAFIDSRLSAADVGGLQATVAPTSPYPAQPRPSSLGPSSTGEESEVEELLRLAGERRLEPVHVDLPPLPEWATPAMREVAEFFKLVRGVRL
jgi:hypothetical protein